MTHAPEARLIGSSALLNAKVCAPQGDCLGETRELLIVMMTGHVHYVVLETFGSDSGPVSDSENGSSAAPRRVLVPWGAMKWNEERGCLILDMTADRLAAAPPFDPRSTGDWENTEWHQQVQRYYGIEPHWEKPQNYTG